MKYVSPSSRSISTNTPAPQSIPNAPPSYPRPQLSQYRNTRLPAPKSSPCDPWTLHKRPRKSDMRPKSRDAAGAQESRIIEGCERGEVEKGEGRKGSEESERGGSGYLESDAWGDQERGHIREVEVEGGKTVLDGDVGACGIDGLVEHENILYCSTYVHWGHWEAGSAHFAFRKQARCPTYTLPHENFYAARTAGDESLYLPRRIYRTSDPRVDDIDD